MQNINSKQSFLSANMSICEIGEHRWFATSSVSFANCYEISYINYSIEVKRLTSSCKPRTNNKLILVGDYIYNMGGEI